MTSTRSLPDGTSMAAEFPPSSAGSRPLRCGPGGYRDRPVTTGRRVPVLVEEDDPESGARIVWFGNETSVLVGVAPRLVDDEPAHLVGVSRNEGSLVQNGPALDIGRSATTIRNGSPAVW